MRRWTSVLPFVVISALFACKPRNPEASQVKSDDEDAASDENVSFDTFHRLFDRHAKELEDMILAGGGEIQNVEGLALADYDEDALKEAQKLADRLRKASKETVIEQRAEFESLAFELEAMTQLLQSDIPGSDLAKLSQAVKRVRGILDAPPPKKEEVVYTPPTPPPPKTKAPEIDYNDLYCKDLGDGTYLPVVAQTGQQVGFRGNPGYKGFNNYSNCTSSVSAIRNGMVCTLASNGSVSPHLIKSNMQFGPVDGFQQTKNCVRAMQLSRNNEICLIDNRDGVNKYAKYNMKGQPIDYWFETVEKCMAGDKSPDARTICLQGVRDRYDTCLRIAKWETDSMKRTSKELKCILANLKEQDLC